ncbi:kinesin-like protein KIF26B [Alosa pseudoharengus]|uniref:kinesin-like protein KIF26B n=1 Tax=Alosa pseudoharengus TaxID=34774 RepID=UPI003F88F662
MTSPFEDKSGPSLISRGRRYVLTDDQPGGLSRGKRCQAAPETAYIERPSPEGAGSTSDTHGAPSLRSGFSSLGSLVASYPPGVTESPCSVTVSTGYGTLSPESRNKKPLDYDHVLCDSCDSEDASVVPLCAIEAWYESDGQCDVCATNLRQLKQKALHTILTQEQAIWARDPSPAGLSSPRPPKRAPGPNTLPRTSSPRSSPAKPVLKSSGQGKGTTVARVAAEGLCMGSGLIKGALMKSAPGRRQSAIGLMPPSCQVDEVPRSAGRQERQMSQSTAATPEATTPTATSTAVAFFVRAVQKLNLSSRRKKPCSALPSDVDAPSRVTDFCGLLLRSPPLVPRHLLQASTPGKPTPGTGKGQVKVMLRVSPMVDSCLKLDGRRKQVTILDPITHNPQQQTTASKVTPRSFTFDAVFTPESMQGEVCESALPGPLQAVMNGADGCIIGFGRAGTGKSYTMTGKDDSILSLGVIPCAISWLFRLVSKRREKTGAEISVSITATEVYGRNEVLRDLLYTEDMSNFGNGQKPVICLCEDPVSGIQLMNQSVVSAPTAERAASLLDIALSSRSGNRPGVSSHMFFTLHVHQQHTQGPTKDVVCGGQSRLILIDLGSCVEEHSKSMAQLSFPELSSVMLTLLRGGKQVPNRNSKLTMLLQESLGNVNCQTTVIAHVSGSAERLSDTLSTLQIIARIHKMQRKAKKSRSSSPSERSVRKEKKLLQETKLRAFHSTGTLGPDVPAPKLFRDKEDRSGSDLSCDTVIHVDSDGCNTDVNKKPQESISIIPSLLKSKTIEIANPLQAMKQRPQRTFLKDFRLIHRSQEEKETKMSATQEAEMEYFKCSTFAELQERLGCIDGSELISQGQSTEAVGKVQPLPEAKKEAEKTDIANPVPSIQENTEGNGYRAACETKIIDTGLIDSFQSDPTDHKEIPSDRPLADNLGNPADSRSQTSASDSDQCSAELEMTKSQGQSSDESLLHPEYRISPIGKSSSKSSSSGSSLSSSSMSASTDSPITLTDTTPQLSAEGQREMRATITVTVQQPFDLNGQDELVYTVVEEVTISGMAEKGRPTNVISFSEGSSLQALTTGSQPVRIISSVSEDASMLDSSAKNGALERQPLLTSQERYELTSNQVSSNKPETHGVHSGASVEGLYQHSSRELENQTKTQSSMACEMAQHASSTLVNSGGKPSLEKLQCGANGYHSPTQNEAKKCKDKDVNVFSSRVKLDQKTSGVTRDPTTEFRPEKKATGKKASQLNKHQSFKGEAIMSPASRRRLVDAYDLTRASRSGKRYPKFLPMDDQDADCSISASRSNLSKASAVSKLMMSSSKPSRSSASSAKTMNLITKSLRQSFRSSSLSPDGTSSGHGSWSTQSLSRSQGSSFSSIKIMNGRITELLRGNGDPVSGADQGGSEYKEKGAAKNDESLPLPSPYSRVTAPRLPSHCSGHASDTTSILSGELPPAMGKTSLLCNRNSVVSSGYESLMRDSSATGSSMSIRESTSDHSCTHSLARSGRSSKRRTNSAAGTSQRRPSQETLLSLRRSASGPRVRWGDRGAADSYEIKVYEIDNVDCLQRRGLCSNRGVACFSAKLKFLEHRQQRIVELRSKYNHLKRELEQAKQYLMLDPEKWSQEFDLWQTFEVDSLEHLEALELVTARLESRLNQCKAHTMMVTCFDAAPKRRQKRTKRHRPSPDQKGFL